LLITPLKIVVSQFKKEILKAETLLYQDVFILVDEKVIAIFTDRCLLKKRNYLLSCQSQYLSFSCILEEKYCAKFAKLTRYISNFDFLI